MKLDLRPLLAGDRLLEFDYELPLDSHTEDTTSFLWGTRFPSPMKVTGNITNTAGYMRMSLSLSCDYVAQCARCLSPVEGQFSLSLEKTVAPKNLLGDITEDKLDDYAIIEDGFLDMDEQLLEQLEMEFPLRAMRSCGSLSMIPPVLRPRNKRHGRPLRPPISVGKKGSSMF